MGKALAAAAAKANMNGSKPYEQTYAARQDSAKHGCQSAKEFDCIASACFVRADRLMEQNCWSHTLFYVKKSGRLLSVEPCAFVPSGLTHSKLKATVWASQDYLQRALRQEGFAFRDKSILMQRQACFSDRLLVHF